MTKFNLLFYLFFILSLAGIYANGEVDYKKYHQQVVVAETLIGTEDYVGALEVYDNLFGEYDFIFLRDYQIATQLALQVGNTQKAFEYVEKGMLAGWHMKAIKRNRYLDVLREDEGWKSKKEHYKTLYQQYESNLDQALRKRVKKLFSKDQWKALGALFTFGSKGQDRYAEKKFAPHSEKQIAKFLAIYQNHGYPGEKLVGNDYWMSTVLSHHNSISEEYVQNDTLYTYLQPKLEVALVKGQISAFEFVLIDEWYRVVVNKKGSFTYGILEPPTRAHLTRTNELRRSMFLRSIEVHNKLVAIEEKTGMSFYLEGHPWMKGKIEVK